jgi:hypothetical protein
LNHIRARMGIPDSAFSGNALSHNSSIGLPSRIFTCTGAISITWSMRSSIRSWRLWPAATALNYAASERFRSRAAEPVPAATPARALLSRSTRNPFRASRPAGKCTSASMGRMRVKFEAPLQPILRYPPSDFCYSRANEAEALQAKVLTDDEARRGIADPEPISIGLVSRLVGHPTEKHP